MLVIVPKSLGKFQVRVSRMFYDAVRMTRVEFLKQLEEEKKEASNFDSPGIPLQLTFLWQFQQITHAKGPWNANLVDKESYKKHGITSTTKFEISPNIGLFD
jgi:hypothetical protein